MLGSDFVQKVSWDPTTTLVLYKAMQYKYSFGSPREKVWAPVPTREKKNLSKIQKCEIISIRHVKEVIISYWYWLKIINIVHLYHRYIYILMLFYFLDNSVVLNNYWLIEFIPWFAFALKPVRKSMDSKTQKCSFHSNKYNFVNTFKVYKVMIPPSWIVTRHEQTIATLLLVWEEKWRMFILGLSLFSVKKKNCEKSNWNPRSFILKYIV